MYCFLRNVIILPKARALKILNAQNNYEDTKKSVRMNGKLDLIWGNKSAYLYVLLTHRGVEQLVARRAHNPKVAGSNPAPATKVQECACTSDMYIYIIPQGALI